MGYEFGRAQALVQSSKYHGITFLFEYKKKKKKGRGSIFCNLFSRTFKHKHEKKLHSEENFAALINKFEAVEN